MHYMLRSFSFLFFFNSYEDDADSKCKECLDKAMEHDPSNAEAFQLLASYWLSMENKQVRVRTTIWPNHKEGLQMRGVKIRKSHNDQAFFPSPN